MADPPQAGATAFLEWEDQEVACSVVWATQDMCGVAFERAIEDAVVVATAKLARIIEEPIAALHNIPLGKKRSAPVEQPASRSAEPQNLSSWSVSLPLPKGSRGRQEKAPVTAAEEMFFYGSPLAHVVAYEAHLSSSY